VLRELLTTSDDSTCSRQPQRWRTPVGLALLVVAGITSIALADLTQGWDTGTKRNRGPDYCAFMGVTGVAVLGLLVPGDLLSARVRKGWQVLAMLGGAAAWLLVSVSLAPLPPASPLERCGFAACALVVICGTSGHKRWRRARQRH